MPRNLVASVTEIQRFQSCKRRWWLGRQWDEEWDKPHFFLGSLVHAALEGFYTAKKIEGTSSAYKYQVETLWQYFNGYVDDHLPGILANYGEYSGQAKEAYDGIIEVASRMLENYLEYEQTADLQFKRVVQVEKRYYVDLGGGNYLTAKIDLICNDGMFYRITDHKTSKGSATTGKALDLDEQLTGYTYVVWKKTDHIMEPTYNVLKKKAPEKPRILKNGTISKAKGQNTSYALMLEAITQHGADPDDYFEVLEHLQASGWDAYFYREGTPRNKHQLLSYEWRTRLIMEEMRDIIADPKLAYPTPNGFKCARCPFLSVCNAMEDGSHYESLLESSFERTSNDLYDTPERQKQDRNVQLPIQIIGSSASTD